MGCVDAYAADAPNSVAFVFCCLIITIVATKSNTYNFLLVPLILPYNLTITLLLLRRFCPSTGVHHFQLALQ